MDKLLAMSILSSSPADVAASSWMNLSWSNRRKAVHTTSRDKDGAKSSLTTERERSSAAEAKDERRREKPHRPRFAPELDGLHCFETIVGSH
ncbi:hypothetical protein ACMD2_27400 [Ananas comosus]|uniref:Uncharacterized protein n=1 Tax=Ananas comosus TaxID=4615 RepID=A0A199VMJ0_ANACO|nr:hypothetical protein ACMD2_27400 [Ananas comosus]